MTKRFIALVSTPEPYLGPPPPAMDEATARLREEAERAGIRFELGGLAPTASGSRVRLARNRIKVTDGPFAEAKEVIGGFAIFNAPSHEEALRWLLRFMEVFRDHWPEWEGESELRELAD